MSAPAKLIIGFPLGATMPSKFFSHWLQMDHSHLVGAVTVTGVYITQNMDMMVERALAADGDRWDRLVVLEHDMIAPLDALTRIAAYRDEHDIVGSMYFQRDPPHHANALIEAPGCKFDPISPVTVRQWCDDPQLYEVGAVGFGLTSVAQHVLVDWDTDIPMFNIDHTFGSHDLWFCHHARKQGYKVFVDSAIVCEHLAEIPVGVADNQRLAAGASPSAWPVPLRRTLAREGQKGA